MPQNLRTISLIVPAFNEEGNLPALIERSFNHLPKYFSRFEIIVVDDGSTDQTASVVKQAAQKNGAVQLIQHSSNLGVGAALRNGIKKAQWNWVFHVPADNQFDIAEVENFLPLLDEADIIVGWRCNLHYTLIRSVVGKTYRFLLRSLFGICLKDPTWVKMVRRECALKALPSTDGFFGEIELLIRSKRLGSRLREVPVHIQERLYGQSKAASFRRILQTFLELIRFKIKN